MQEMQPRSLGREDPLEKEMATLSSILAWEIPWTEEPGGLQVHGVSKESDTTQGLNNNMVYLEYIGMTSHYTKRKRVIAHKVV